MKVLAIVLAGGKGTRLAPLVKDRCKPAVPFGGKFRIIDFVLSNCLNSGIRQINVMIQYKSDSLQKHIRDAWSIFSPYLGEYIDVYPPQQRVSEHFYSGTADAVYQNLFTIESEKPDYVLILSGDHIYSMNYRSMIEYHIEKNADMTIASIPVPIKEGPSFGVLQIDESEKIIQFHEKPKNPSTIPNDPTKCLASMGIYVFTTNKLVKWLLQDAKSDTSHDFGKDIIPAMILEDNVYTYLFCDKDKNPLYWRDVGTLLSYYYSNMDILDDKSGFTINDRNWQFRTHEVQSAPAKIIGNKSAKVINSYVASGCQIEGSVINSILGNNVRVGEGSIVKNCLLFDGVYIQDYVTVEKAILDKYVTVNPGRHVGGDPTININDIVYEDGITIIPKDTVI